MNLTRLTFLTFCVCAILALSACGRNGNGSARFVETVGAVDNETQEVVIATTVESLKGTTVTLPPGTLSEDTEFIIDKGTTTTETFGGGGVSSVIKVTVDKPLNGPVTLRIPVTLAENQSIDDVVVLKMREGFDTPQLQNVTRRSGDGEIPAWVEIEQITFSEFLGAIPGEGVWQPLTELIPSGQYGHSAIWTGETGNSNTANRMIIWAGSQLVGAYHPETQSWRTLSNDGINDFRSLSGAVITGDSAYPQASNKLVLIGISNDNQFIGSIYDIASDSWHKMAKTNLLDQYDSGASVVATDRQLIIWGGQDSYFSGGKLLNTGAIYDFVTNTWQQISSGDTIRTHRKNHTAIWAKDRMYFFGGDVTSAHGLRVDGPNTNFFTEETNDGGMYDPITGAWTHLPNIGPLGYQGYVIVEDQLYQPSNNVLRRFTFDPEHENGGVWEAITPSDDVSYFYGDGPVIHANGKIVITEVGDDNGVATYDLSTGAWETVEGHNWFQNRRYYSAAYSGSEVLFWGGYDLSQRKTKDDGVSLKLNPAEGESPWSTFSERVFAPIERYGSSAIWDGSKVLVWGGSSHAFNRAGEDIGNNVGAYDPVTRSWSVLETTGTPPAARDSHIWVQAGEDLIVWGGSKPDGFGTSEPYHYDGGVFNSTSKTWRPIPADPEVQWIRYHRPIWTGDQMIIWGGQQNAPGESTSTVNTGWALDPDAETNAWKQLSTDGAPSARSEHTTIWTGSKMIVWGGRYNSILNNDPTVYFNDGAIYDPETDTWESMALPVGEDFELKKRSGHSAVWTGTEMIVWGGIEYHYNDDKGSWEGTTYADGAAYNPVTNTWRKLNMRNAPSKRSSHSATWTGKSMVVFGGRSSVNDSNYLNDGGVYNPTEDTWTATSTVDSASARLGHEAIWTGVSMLVWGGQFRTPYPAIFTPELSAFPLKPSISSATPSNGAITVSWESAADASSYRVLYSTKELMPAEETTVLKKVTSPLVIDGLKNGVEYFVELRAMGTVGESPSSDQLSATPFFAAPAQLSTKARDGGITVYWQSVDGITRYRLFVSENEDMSQSDSVEIISVELTDATLAYTLDDLTNDTTYYFQVAGVDDFNLEGDRSEIISASPAPSVPPSFAITATRNDGEVVLSWDEYPGATSYKVFIADTAEGVATATPITVTGSLMHTISGRTNGEDIFFAVTYVNAAGESALEEPMVTSAAFPMPTLSSVTAGVGEIAVSWAAVTDANGYKVYFHKSSDDSRRASVINVGASTLSTTITGLEPGVEYSVFLTVYGANFVESAPTASQSATPILPAPQNVQVEAGVGEATVTWDPVEGATGYNLYWSTQTITDLSAATKVDAVTSPYTLSGLENGTQYFVVVRAIIGDGEPSVAQWTAMPTLNAPSARFGHTAVWTGEAMVLIGGSDGTAAVTDIGLFTPDGMGSGTWATHTVEGISGGYAIWTGEHILVGDANVWGALTLSPTGGAPTWQLLPTENAHTNGFATAVWTGERLIVWGGLDGVTTGSLNTGATYTPGPNFVDGTWSALPTEGAPQGRHLHSAVWTGDRMIVFGGKNLPLDPGYNNGASYTPDASGISGVWSSLPTENAPSIYDHAAIWTGTQMLVSDGGIYTPDSAGGGVWSQMSLEGAAAFYYGTAFAWTGKKLIAYEGSVDNIGAVYSPDSQGGSWRAMETANAPSVRYGATAIWTGSEFILWGGFDNSTSEALGDGALYTPYNSGVVGESNPSSEATVTPNLPAPQNVQVIAGATDITVTWDPVAEADGYSVYYSTSDITATTDLATLNSQSSSSTSGTISNLTPGSTYYVVVTAQTISGSTVVSESLPTATQNVTLTLGTPTFDTGLGWVDMTTTGAPSPRRLASAVWTGSELIVWGGDDDDPMNPEGLGDGAIFTPGPNGGSWRPMSSTGAPDPRYEHAAIWTGTQMIVWGGKRFNTTDMFEETLTTGGIFTPDAQGGTWQPMTDNSNLFLSFPRAVWTGTHMIVVGDQSSGGLYQPGPSGGTWTGDVPQNNWYRRPAVHWDGTSLLTWGGEDWTGGSGGLYTNNAQRFTPDAQFTTGTWSTVAQTNAPANGDGKTIVDAFGKKLMVSAGMLSPTVIDEFQVDGNGDLAWSTYNVPTGSPSGYYANAVAGGGDYLFVWGGSSINTGDVANTGKVLQASTPTDPTATINSLSQEFSSVAAAHGYRMYYSTTEITATTDLASLDKVEGTSSPLSVPSLQPGTLYYFVLTSIYTDDGTLTGNLLAESAPTAVRQVVTLLDTPVVNTPSIGSGSVDLSWSAVTGATDYDIYYSTTSPVDTTGTPTTSVQTTSASLTGLTNGTEYLVVVVARNSLTESLASSEASATPLFPAPANPAATAGDSSVLLAWDDVPGATTYNVYYGIASGVMTATGTAETNVSSPAIVGSLNNGTEYFFIVVASDGINPVGNVSIEVSATPTIDAPNDLTATAGDTQVTLNWTAVFGAVSYNVYYGTSTGLTTASTSTSVMTNSATITGLTNGTQYFFAVASVGMGLPGPLSTEASATPAVSTGFSATSTTSAPDARGGHTAVMVGSEMIVWGGQDGFLTLLNSGGHYNLSNDSWVATGSGANVPDARVGHTAVATTSTMIVWGGAGDFSTLDTGGVYDAANKTWTATDTTSANLPAARTLHTAVWTGTEMIVWGGEDDFFAPLGDGARYNPSTNSWTAMSSTNAPSARSGHTAVWDSTNGKMIIWGGDDGFSVVNDGAMYDPSNDTWTSITSPSANDARDGHTAIWTGSEMIIWGGVDSSIQNTNTGLRFNPSTTSWSSTSTTGSVPTGRFGHTAVWDSTNSKMIIWGGSDGGVSPVSDGAVYDPTGDSWTATPSTSAPTGRISHTAIWTSSGMIIWGGDTGPGGVLNTGAVYVP